MACHHSIVSRGLTDAKAAFPRPFPRLDQAARRFHLLSRIFFGTVVTLSLNIHEGKIALFGDCMQFYGRRAPL
jgi:hypothetical protein